MWSRTAAIRVLLHGASTLCACHEKKRELGLGASGRHYYLMRPNLLFVMADDHASHAISAYGSRINQTPNLDRIAEAGMRFNSTFCTNAICTPSRAAILTGTYNHVNGVTTLDTPMDNRLQTYPKLMQEAGYQTAVFGKWHLGHGQGHDPTGFDDWLVLPDQGEYHNPQMLGPDGPVEMEGYVTDLITDLCLDWLERRDPDRPFALMCHHKAPHRTWEPDAKHADMYEDEQIPEPESFWDDYAGKAQAATVAAMRMLDLDELDLKMPLPEGLSETEEISWRYQRYIKEYLRVVASIDDNVGRIIDYLQAEGLWENTVVIYTSDQGSSWAITAGSTNGLCMRSRLVCRCSSAIRQRSKQARCAATWW